MYRKVLNKDDIEFARDAGWTDEQIKNGYEVFECFGSEVVIDGALVIEMIGDIGMYDSDFDACRQAEVDGVKFINDMDGLEKGCYVDVPENRKHCAEMLKKHPEYLVDHLMKAGGEYWERYQRVFG